MKNPTTTSLQKTLCDIALMAEVDRLDPEAIPPVLAVLAALQTRAAARLVQTTAANTTTGARTATRLLNVREAAERIDMSTDWLYRHADRLPFTHRLGGALRFDPAGIERWLATRRR